MRVRPHALLFVAFLVVGVSLLRGALKDGPSVRRVAQVAPAGPTYALSGFLPESPETRVWVVVEGDRIREIVRRKPENLPSVETDDWIFPGMLDLHNHTKYNIIPLWKLARGQFVNRYEWRFNSPEYKLATSFMMKSVKDTSVCAAVRWSELKSLVSGTIVTQGIGADGHCTAGFGARNVEVEGEISKSDKGRGRGMMDLVMPELMGAGFVPKIKPKMERGLSYEAALEAWIQEEGGLAWMDEFKNKPRTVGGAFDLSLGSRQILTDLKIDPETTQDIEPLLPAIKKAVTPVFAGPPLSLKAFTLTDAVEAFGEFVTGFLKSKPEAALDFLMSKGNARLSQVLRAYLLDFETGIRKKALKAYSDPGTVVIAHVSEGRSDDPYNQREFRFAHEAGLIKKGLIAIHGVGLSQDDFKIAAHEQVPIVWSPFSNLLLYGDTLDVAAAQAAGVLLVIGPDWAPTGSRHMLDELKIAKRWLTARGVTSVSDRDLVEMATLNAARAIQREKDLGQVAPGLLADLVVVEKKSGNGYADFVSAVESQIRLVTISGDAKYGDPALMVALAALGKEPEKLESVEACGFKKMFKIQVTGDSLPQFGSYAKIKTELQSRLQDYQKAVLASGTSEQKEALSDLDPLFSCEDELYTKRFSEFIEKELAENAAARTSLRSKYRLVDGWDALSLPIK